MNRPGFTGNSVSLPKKRLKKTPVQTHSASQAPDADCLTPSMKPIATSATEKLQSRAPLRYLTFGGSAWAALLLLR